MRIRTVHTALILAAVTISALWFQVPGIERALFRDWSDDAFFYVVVADNIVEGRGSTSDGIGLTNGYHPLWMAVHLAVRLMFGEPLRAMATIQFAVLAGALLMLYHFLAARFGPTTAVLVALTASFETTFRQVLGSGMETGLAFAALLMTLAVLPAADLGEMSRRRLAAAQASLVVLFFARLDGGLFWLALAAVVLLRGAARTEAVAGNARALFRLLIVPTVLATAYLTFNQVVFGTAMPISGRVKSLGWSEIAEMGAARYVGEAFDRLVVLYAPQTFDLPWGISAYAPRRSMWHAGAWGVWLSLVVLAVTLMVRGLSKRRSLDLPMTALIAFTALHTVYYTLLQGDRYALSWARGPELLLLTVALAWLVSTGLTRWIPRSAFASGLTRPAIGARRIAITLVVGILFVLAWTSSRTRVLGSGMIRDFNTPVRAFQEGVAYIRAHTSEDEIIASESIGFLGHYADRRVVSLDGLLNSMDYYRRYLLTGRKGDYLREHGVRYLSEGLRKDVDPVTYMSGVLGVPASELEVVAQFDGPPQVPRRYVVLVLNTAVPRSK